VGGPEIDLRSLTTDLEEVMRWVKPKVQAGGKNGSFGIEVRGLI
jgi:hypothetical protein